MPDKKPACEPLACNPSTFELETRQSGSQGQPRLLNNLTTSVVTALRTNPVIKYSRTAIRAGCESRNYSHVVCSSFVTSLFGDSVFRMCHCSIFLIY